MSEFVQKHSSATFKYSTLTSNKNVNKYFKQPQEMSPPGPSPPGQGSSHPATRGDPSGTERSRKVEGTEESC